MDSPAPPLLEFVVFWRDEMRTFELPEQGEVTIGRAPENRIQIEHPSVSRRHARLTLGPELVIEDLGAANGTFVRDRSCEASLHQTRTMHQLTRTSAELAVGESVMFGEVTALVRRATPAPTRFGELDSELNQASGVVVRNRAMREVYAQAERAARASISVLVLGETGVGKELLARAIHARSPRANAPFMSINCAALAESLLEGEIFGYERGAFTGAIQARAGLFEAADGGSVFLDEIGELAPSTQAKLLRVLEERKVTRLGARQPRAIDVRFLAATNRDLEAEAQAGRFRSDLYFRVAGLCLTIPPLRERPEEIEALARCFLDAALSQLERHGTLDFSDETLSILRAHAWPGNVRELKNVVERAVILCAERTIVPEHLPASLLRRTRPSEGQAAPAAGSSLDPSPASAGPVLAPDAWQAEMKDLERKRLLQALEQCGGNQTRAAELLQVSRRTLVSRLSEFGLTRPRRRDA
jgi:transcriptional regulator with PAS, ATPase and Fis domain